MAKRFYTEVRVVEVAGGYEIQLDGRTLKTPGTFALVLSERRHADLIAQEWDAQVDEIKPETMPVTRLVNVAVEQTPLNRERLVNEARNYGATDLLCYRASEPDRLVVRQTELWDPLLVWAEEQGIGLKTTQSIRATEQATEALEAIADQAANMDNLTLTLCVHLIAVFGSAILGFAVIERHVEGLTAYGLSCLDEAWQAEQWGEDEEAAARTHKIRTEVQALCRLL